MNGCLFYLMEKIANCFFLLFFVCVWRGVLNLQLSNEDAKGLISDHNSKYTHNGLTKKATKTKTTIDVT